MIPLRVNTDPAYRAASWLAKHVDDQLRRHRRIERVEGVAHAEALVFVARGLSATPLADLEAALRELLRLKLLVEEPDGPLLPKRAPPPPRPKGPSGRVRHIDHPSVPDGVDAHRWAAFDAWKARLPEEDRAQPFEALWKRHGESYRPRRRPSDRAENTAPQTPAAAPLVRSEPPRL